MSKLKILIADDHSAIRRGLKDILSQTYPDAEFGEAIDTSEVFCQLQDTNWDLLILDIDFPGRNGLEVLTQLKEEGNKLPVLVFSFHKEEQIALRAIKSGAAGYLSKDAADTELIVAIRELLAGRKYLSQFVSDQILSQFQDPSKTLAHEQLATREFQTFLLISKGKTVSQIARELNLSISAINTYRARIMKKMELKNNAELMKYAIQNNLV